MQSIKDIKQLFEQAEKEQWNALFPQYKTDERAGVQKLITQYEKALETQKGAGKTVSNARVRTQIRG